MVRIMCAVEPALCAVKLTWSCTEADFVLPLMQKLEQEVAQLQAANAELLQDKQEALPLLDAYRCAQSGLHLFDVFCFSSTL